jgi:hypothetical protein
MGELEFGYVACITWVKPGRPSLDQYFRGRTWSRRRAQLLASRCSLVGDAHGGRFVRTAWKRSSAECSRTNG